MTETLTEVFCDQEFNTQGTSSAIEAVYYSTEERRLFIEFRNGSLAGYEGVQPEIFSALNALNDQRISGIESASVGGYYNEFFRGTGYFQGLNTDNIEIVTQRDREVQERLAKLLNDPEVEARYQAAGDEVEAEYRLSAEEQGYVDAIANVSAEQINSTSIQAQPGSVFVARVEQPKQAFGVSFVIDGDQEHSWRVFGSDQQDALNRFAQAVELLGWDVTAKSITIFLR